jgi:hypothetical protein
MQSFIVLGIIPGTSIQTTLNFWIMVYMLVVLLVCRAQLVAARNELQSYFVARLIAHTINGLTITT